MTLETRLRICNFEKVSSRQIDAGHQRIFAAAQPVRTADAPPFVGVFRADGRTRSVQKHLLRQTGQRIGQRIDHAIRVAVDGGKNFDRIDESTVVLRVGHHHFKQSGNLRSIGLHGNHRARCAADDVAVFNDIPRVFIIGIYVAGIADHDGIVDALHLHLVDEARRGNLPVQTQQNRRRRGAAVAVVGDFQFVSARRKNRRIDSRYVAAAEVAEVRRPQVSKVRALVAVCTV